MSADTLKVLRTVFAPNDRRVALIDGALALNDAAYCAATLDVIERTLPKPAKILASVGDQLRAAIGVPSQVAIFDALPNPNGAGPIAAMRNHVPRVSVAWSPDTIAPGQVRIVTVVNGGPAPARGFVEWWEQGGAQNYKGAIAVARRALDTGEQISIEARP